MNQKLAIFVFATYTMIGVATNQFLQYRMRRAYGSGYKLELKEAITLSIIATFWPITWLIILVGSFIHAYKTYPRKSKGEKTK